MRAAAWRTRQPRRAELTSIGILAPSHNRPGAVVTEHQIAGRSAPLSVTYSCHVTGGGYIVGGRSSCPSESGGQQYARSYRGRCQSGRGGGTGAVRVFSARLGASRRGGP